MDSLRALISLSLKIAFGIFFFVFVWWMVSLLVPAMSIKNVFSSSASASSTPKSDILPSPRKYSGFFTNKNNASGTSGNVYVSSPPYSGNVYVPGEPYNGNGNNGSGYGTVSGSNYSNSGSNGYSYSTYSYSNSNSSGTTSSESVKATPTGSAQPVSATALQNGTTIRNLSIYEGGHIYTGLSFVGEAKSSMFRDGKFPIVLVDTSGHVIGVSAAIAQSTWSVPGWVRFETKIIYALPKNVPCTMIFEEALTQAEKTRAPLRVPLTVKCN